mgnify:CR=1 FL=1
MSWIEWVAERKIQQAQEQGEFDDLEGAGRPLDLAHDARTPPEQRVVDHLLKQARYVPEWVELAREIDRRRERLEREERSFAERRARAMGRARSLAEPALLRELDEARDRFLLRTAEQLRELDRLIARFNLIVPTISRQRRRIRVAESVRALAERYPRWRPLRDGEPWEAVCREESPPLLRLSNRLPRRRRLLP